MCGCTPRECSGSITCGMFDDGCGGEIACGCTAPDTCGGGGIPGFCGCDVTSCGDRGLSCGFADDGCYCGSCSGGETCGVAAPNQCGRPASCLAEGRTCGFSSATPGTFCGGCAEGEMCVDGACVAAVRPFCWSDPISIPLGRPQWAGTAIADGDSLSFYGAHTPDPPDLGCGRMGRYRLTDYATAELDTYEVLPISDFSALSTSGCVGGGSCTGWVSVPRLSKDALEVFVDANYACADWWDSEMYLSTRASAKGEWTLPALIPLGLYEPAANGAGDGVGSGILLSDRRTLLYKASRVANNALVVARRPTARAGDTAFERIDTVVLPETFDDHPANLAPQALSCDGRYLLYYRQLDGNREARAAAILSLDPVMLGPPEAYPGVPDPLLLGFSESPDCGAIYFITYGDPYVRLRIPCP
jgi:hypothetical protein